MNEQRCESTNGEQMAQRHIRVPDEDVLLILHQIVRSRGLRIKKPGRSRRVIELTGTEAEIQSVIEDTSRLATVLQLRQTSVLEAVLTDNGLAVPPELRLALGRMKAKCVRMLGEVPLPGKALISRAQKPGPLSSSVSPRLENDNIGCPAAT